MPRGKLLRSLSAHFMPSPGELIHRSIVQSTSSFAYLQTHFPPYQPSQMTRHRKLSQGINECHKRRERDGQEYR